MTRQEMIALTERPSREREPLGYVVTVRGKSPRDCFAYQMGTLRDAKTSGRRHEGLEVIVTGPRGGRWKLCRDERCRRAKYNWRKLRPLRNDAGGITSFSTVADLLGER